MAALAAAPLRTGDTVMGFSAGVDVVSAYLAGYTPPRGVTFVLVGDTFAYNSQRLYQGRRVPDDVSVPVILLSNQYDGYSDFPTDIFSPGYLLATVNAIAGMFTSHNYASAQLNNPANVMTTKGKITEVLVPTQNLPINRWLRMIGLSSIADEMDRTLRPIIDDAYTRPGPTADQLAASTSQQVPTFPAPIYETSQPVLDQQGTLALLAASAEGGAQDRGVGVTSPQVQSVVLTAGDDPVALGAERQAVERVRVAGQRRAGLVAGARVPDPRRAVGPAGDDPLAVRTERQAAERFRVAGKRRATLVAGARVPHPRRSGGAAGDDRLAGGVDRRAVQD